MQRSENSRRVLTASGKGLDPFGVGVLESLYSASEARVLKEKRKDYFQGHSRKAVC